VPLVTFLQVSDVHLGAPFRWLPAEKRAERQREQQRALEKLTGEAIERGVAAILLPGDLFDQVGVDAESLTFALMAFRVSGCPPVLIAPGNHDPWSEASPTWSGRLLEARGVSWPEHVHVFDRPEWTPVAIEGTPVRVWGRCFASGMASGERPLAAGTLPDLPGDDGLTHIGLFHGTHEALCPFTRNVVGPFTESEARLSPFTYLAVGHIHSRFEMAAADGEPARGTRLAYAGSAIALEPGETGAHGALEVRIDHGTHPPRIAVEPVSLDPRRAIEIEVDVTGTASADQIDRRILTALDEARATVEDIATARLTGRLTRGVRYTAGGPDLGKRVYHLKLDARRLRPDYNLEAYRTEASTTTEARFVQTLLERLDQERNPEARRDLERALYYGLDAFRLREVSPAWEEIAE
jgi:DNA repair exonuclease SbcCD nuclease subunit